MWRELQTAARIDLLIPEVVAERCVHKLVEQASCRACVDACPRNAWILDDDMLGIDADRCDGCDLCVPACPQGAIEARFAPLLRATRQGGVAFAACEHARIERGGDGLMPCLHALGMADLLQLHRNGANLLVTSRGDCEHCERGGVKRIDERLDEVNRLLVSRGIEPLKHRDLNAGAWADELGLISELSSLRTLDRRAFFRNAVRLPKERLQAAIEDAKSTFIPPGLLLCGDAPDVLFPFVPKIDPERCNGCDACMWLCPREAIRLHRGSRGESAFVIQAERCSGCGICTDVCEQDSVSTTRLSQSVQRRIALRTERCRACGTEFHLPSEARDDERLCWVCHQNNRGRNLFQVLD